MQTVSLCMIVRDEEDVLGRCLDSVSGLVDEIIIVDTGSQDSTKEIAARYTRKLFDFPWIDDFAAARNFSFEKASGDYCMWLDADDIFTDSAKEKFQEMKKNLTRETDVVMMPYHVGFDENGQVTFSYYRERIVKNHQGMRWKGPVHEVIETHGNILYADCPVTHWKLHPSDPDRNLRIFQNLLTKGEVLEPRQQFYYGRELYYHHQYGEALCVLEKYLSGGEGWVENQIDACRHCAFCFYGLGHENDALAALFRSFCFDLPRAEVCCDIGQHFLDRKSWRQAAYWYERALSCERRDDRGGFVLPDAYGFLPNIQLCVCYSHMGEIQKAKDYNERAAVCKPDSPAVAQNRVYFASLEKSQ